LGAKRDRLYRLGRRDAGTACAKSVPEFDVFIPLRSSLIEKQVPQIPENTEKSK
jgi:hypothetical protein